MKAMILAAGLGTRLLPLTKTIPKALIPLNGVPLLEIVIHRLKNAGFNEIIVNAHHHPEQIRDFIGEKSFPGLRIEISFEEELLDTGGALKKAAWFFDDGQPFLLHNVDVLTDMDYTAMMDFHRRREAVATLAVRKRKSSRYMLFESEGKLSGWKSIKTNEVKEVGPLKKNLEEYAFSGIHVVSPKLFEYFSKESTFSIIDTYLQAAKQGAAIYAFPTNQWRWIDAGKLGDLPEAEKLARKLRG